MEPPPYNPWDPPPPPPPPAYHWGPGGGFPPDPFHHHPHPSDFPYDGPPPPPPHHFPPPFNGPPDHFPEFGGGGNDFPPNPPFFRKRKFENENGQFAKLFVGGIPRHVCEDEVRHLFQEHGNVVEVVLLNDKKTGQQQEYCFVKYASIEEAERAITAVHLQFTFPGAMAPLRVRFADGERHRLGLNQFATQDSTLSRSGPMQHDTTFSGPVPEVTVHKVYVNGLNREASMEEIEEIFSSYGVVADMYIMRDDMKQSRGCGFVGFSQRCMAMAAINGLNGIYVMRGCDKPLIVRFADPKKPKYGDARPAPFSADMQRKNISNDLHMGISPTCANSNLTDTKAGMPCPVANQFCAASREVEQALPGRPFSPSRLSQMSLLESQTSQVSFQSSRKVDSQPHSPRRLKPGTNGDREHHHQACRDVELNSAPLSSESVMDCDWSEHICPDGCKYYFNCVTTESKWEKPEEFAVFEQQLLRHQWQNSSRKEPHTFSAAEAASEVHEIEAAQTQSETSEFEKPQMPVPCAVEHNNEQLLTEACSLDQPAFVQ